MNGIISKHVNKDGVVTIVLNKEFIKLVEETPYTYIFKVYPLELK